MGRILLCESNMLQHPYYVACLSCTIYSMEELYYVLANYTELVDTSIMNDELCGWIAENSSQILLATELRQIMEAGNSLKEFIDRLLTDTNYLTDYEKRKIVQNLGNDNAKSTVEKMKKRGDYLTKRHKYLSAANEYFKALKKCNDEEEKGIRAAILHNIAFIYAQLFQFKKASIYLKESYDISKNQETYKQYVASLRFMLEEEAYLKKVMEVTESENMALDLEEEITEFLENNDQYKGDLKKALQYKEEGNIHSYYQVLENILENEKEKYRLQMV